MSHEKEQNNSTNEKHLEIMIDLIKSASVIYVKGTSFYFIILGTANIFALSDIATPETKQVIIKITIYISIIFGIILFMGLYGIWKGGKQIEFILKEIDEKAFFKNKVNQFFNRGLIIFSLTTILVGVLLIFIIASFYFRSV